MNKRGWGRTNLQLIPCAALFISAAVISAVYGNVRTGGVGHKVIAVIWVCVFVIFAVAFLHVLAKAVHGLIAYHRLGTGRAAAIQFILRIVGYITIMLMTLNLLGVPVGRLLLGGAALGIILGVAAQQALANFFASIVLIVSHPFTVGQSITLYSGALGGTYVGKVVDIGLTHTRMVDVDGNTLILPNATVLSGAVIMSQKPEALPKTTKE
jgi:small-conductance mechanosensitive channel